MSKSTYTPGPWEAQYHDSLGWFVATVEKIVKNDPGKFPPEYRRDILGDEDYPEKEADARLIAEAPAMAEALKQAVQCVEYCRRAHRDIQSELDAGIPVEAEWKAILARIKG